MVLRNGKKLHILPHFVQCLHFWHIFITFDKYLQFNDFFTFLNILRG